MNIKQCITLTAAVTFIWIIQGEVKKGKSANEPSSSGLCLSPVLCSLRWPNTVFSCAVADAIQRAHKDFKKETCRQ